MREIRPEDIPAAAIEAGTKAMYEIAVQAAIRHIDTTPIQFDDIPQLFERLKEESDTGQILIFGSFLEDRILSLIRCQMKHIETGADDEMLFGSNGPLATMSSRVLLAYQLGWLEKSQVTALSAFRKIRNAFAHRAFKISMSDQKIRDHFRAIEFDFDNMVAATNKASLKYADPALMSFADAPERVANLAKLAALAHRTFQDLLVLPHANFHRVSPGSITGEFGKSTKVSELLSKSSETMIKLLATPEFIAKCIELAAQNKA